MTNKRRITVIDDDPKHADLLDYRLSRHQGFEVVIISRSSNPLIELKRTSPDVIIIDPRLNRGNGPELLTATVAWAAFRHIKVIVLTTPEPSDVDGRSYCAAGAHRFMAKPFSPRELIAQVTELLNPEES